VELARSQLAALQFQNDVRQQEAKLRAARNRLSFLLGRGTGGADMILAAGDLHWDAPVGSLESLRQVAFERRPDLQALGRDRARSAADPRLQIANGIVDYTVSGEYPRQESSDLHGNAFAVSFSAPLPFFNRNQGEIARARVQERQIDAKTRALEAEIDTD